MKLKNLTLPSLFALVLFSLAGCGTAKLPTSIDKGKIQDDFTITITDNNTILKPDEFFSLSPLNLKASTHAWKWGKDETLNVYKELGQNGYPFYNVTIQKPGYPKYYGRVAFLNTTESNTEAVSRYYEIKIPSTYFERAKGGRIACVYEFSTKGYGETAGSKIAKSVLAVPTLGMSALGGKGARFNPTWIIWLSDTPL